MYRSSYHVATVFFGRIMTFFDVVYHHASCRVCLIMNRVFNVQLCTLVNRIVLRQHIPAQPSIFHTFLSSRSLWTASKPSKPQLSRRLVVSVNLPTVTTTTWVDRLPGKVQPYLYLTRIDKPIGTLLLFYPCGLFRLLVWLPNS